MKEVLVVHYSQSGQLTDILHNVVRPLEDDPNIQLSYYQLRPKVEFEFPWKSEKFFDTFPETYLQLPQAIEPPNADILSKKYDLIILGYQVWFLTPSIPFNSFLKSAAAKQLLNNTPVITVIGCRNLWMMAQEKVKQLIVANQAKLVGHIVLQDRHINHISVITISHWMFSGKKDRYLGIFPKPGVSDKDIQAAIKFGHPIQAALLNNNFHSLQENLLALDAVQVKSFLITVDKRANFLFGKWANLIIKKGKPGEAQRLKWTKLFSYYLQFAIWIIAPIVFIIFLLTFLPMYRNIQKDKTYYSSVKLR